MRLTALRRVSLRLGRKGRILWGLRKMPTAPGSLGTLLFGHTFALARGVTRYPCTWDLFSIWSRATAPVRRRVGVTRRWQCLRARRGVGASQEPVRVQIFTEQCAVIGDPALMKRVLQTNLKNYGKDLEFSYSPFIVRRGFAACCSEHTR